MKIIAYDRFKPGVTLDSVSPYLRDEVSNVWRLWKAGIVRENYARAELAPGDDEAVFDKITMSAFEGTPLSIALRDCGVRSVVLCGIALEIGIDPTARHAADLGIVPIIVRDACGHGNAEAAERTLTQLAFLGDAQITDVATITGRWV